MKRIGASLTAILLALTLTACDDTDSSTTQSAEVIQSEPQASDQVGQLLTIAEANLELEGYEVETVTDSGKSIFKKGNWTVIEQKQNDNQVLLTVTKNEDKEEGTETPAAPTEQAPTPEPAVDEERSAALTQATKDAFGGQEFTEILVSDPTLWAGYINGIRVEGDLAYYTLQISADDLDREEFGQQAARALSTLLPASAVEGIDWIIVEDGAGTVIAQEQPNPIM
ncbi:hypothetical protein FYJ24_09430 [Actinomycetaceae bacterium WB03_NA08]|uniref:Lipoprotein n=1 Tax=Scrofimicrobium canadense TaxID=2652290 RepID=A0A6N7VVH0_9ACTO|nr:hypothetical protein [Scrofimicrobium canadense]MSS84980.1 hypothetical protein [Scrofimicrobium canadense]